MAKKGRSFEDAQRERDARRQDTPAANKLNGHAKPASRFKLLGLDDLDVKPDEDWLVEGMLPRAGVGVLYGRWKSFKSFVVLDLAWALADPQRATWAGQPIKRHGVVIYIVCEGQSGMRKRLLAYKLDLQGNEPPLLYRIEQRPILGQPRATDVVELVNAIRSALPRDDIVLVVIDTLARTLGGADENNEGMRNFLDNAEDLTERLKCLVLAVHHEGAAGSDRPRGGTVLPAGVVVTWRVKRERGQGLKCRLIVEEAKDSVSDKAFDVTLRKYEFPPTNEDDERRESTLMVDSIVPAEAEPARDYPVKRPMWQLALDVAQNTVVDFPEALPGTRQFPKDTSGSKLERLRQALITADVIDTEDAGKRSGQWRDIKKALKQRGLMKVVDDLFWLPVRQDV